MVKLLFNHSNLNLNIFWKINSVTSPFVVASPSSVTRQARWTCSYQYIEDVFSVIKIKYICQYVMVTERDPNINVMLPDKVCWTWWRYKSSHAFNMFTLSCLINNKHKLFFILCKSQVRVILLTKLNAPKSCPSLYESYAFILWLQ